MQFSSRPAHLSSNEYFTVWISKVFRVALSNDSSSAYPACYPGLAQVGLGCASSHALGEEGREAPGDFFPTPEARVLRPILALEVGAEATSPAA